MKNMQISPKMQITIVKKFESALFKTYYRLGRQKYQTFLNQILIIQILMNLYGFNCF